MATPALTSIAALVDVALRTAGIPIVGVSLGDEGNRATWTVQFDASATAAQQTQAATILTTVAVDVAAQRTQAAIDRLQDKALLAVALWCAGKFTETPAQARTEILAIYNGLP